MIDPDLHGKIVDAARISLDAGAPGLSPDIRRAIAINIAIRVRRLIEANYGKQTPERRSSPAQSAP